MSSRGVPGAAPVLDTAERIRALLSSPVEHFRELFRTLSFVFMWNGSELQIGADASVGRPQETSPSIVGGW